MSPLEWASYLVFEIHKPRFLALGVNIRYRKGCYAFLQVMDGQSSKEYLKLLAWSHYTPLCIMNFSPLLSQASDIALC